MATWQETVEHFAQVTDRLGKSIDPGIFETVVALNLLGIRTTQSCEGHLDWGTTYPWIDIQPEVKQKYQLYQYLALFYQERSTANFDTMLIFHGYRLRPNYAAIAEPLPEEQQQQKLQTCKHEIQAFTTFLKSLIRE